MKRTSILVALAISVCSANAQALYVPAGQEVFISASQLISIDSLTLVPSSNFSITGPNQLSVTSTLNHTAPQTSVARAYRFSQPLTGFSGRVRMYYRDSELAGINESTLAISDHDGNSWSTYLTSVTRDATANYVEVSGLANVTLGELTMSSALSPLPLSFVSVALRQAGSTNVIGWQTANESDCRYFFVQASTDGSRWESISQPVTATNNSLVNKYEWTDADAAAHRYYRVKLVNTDGSVVHSRIVSVTPAAKEAGWKLFPNPALNEISITTADPSLLFTSVNITETGGRSAINVKLQSGQSTIISLEKLSPGNYFMIVTFTDGSRSVRQFQKR